MDLDIKKAIKSPFSDDKWYIKLIFPSIMSIFYVIFKQDNFHLSNPFYLVSFIIGIIPLVIYFGFLLQFGHNEIHDEKPLLPVLRGNIKKYINLGFKAILIIIIYFAMAVFVFLIAIILYKTNSLFLKLLSFPLFILILSMFIFLFMPLGIFADTYSLEDTCNFKKILSLIKRVIPEFIIFVLIQIILELLLSAIGMILIITVIGAPLVLVLYAIIELIRTNLTAQVYKIAKYRLETNV